MGAAELNEEGYALDFHQVRDLLAKAVAPLDRSDLNDHPEIGALVRRIEAAGS